MSKVIDIQPHLEQKFADQPFSVREAICLACLNRFMLCHATNTWLKNLTCDCGVKGKIIGTGQEIEE